MTHWQSGFIHGLALGPLWKWLHRATCRHYMLWSRDEKSWQCADCGEKGFK